MNSKAARARIAELSELNAFISLTGEEGAGPVVAVKDLIDVKGTVTTAGGTLLGATPAAQDAPLVRRIRESGAVIIGKTNLHEWAFGLTSENPHYGAVRNPHDPRLVAGGSSGGSAVAVATGMCDWAVGTDTGGSIRVPAAYCGVVGFKPSLGLVDTEGVFPLSRTLDTIGPLAGSVAQAARALEVMAGTGPLVPVAPRALAQLRVGAVRAWASDLEPEVRRGWDAASAGLPEARLPDPDWLAEPAALILQTEAAAVHRHWIDAHPESYGKDVLQLLLAARQVSRRDYSNALLRQAVARATAEAALEPWDAVLVPATRIMPPAIGAPYKRVDVSGFTRPFNATGHPVVCLPAPVDGLPVGIQVVSRFGQEALLTEVAMALESAWR